ncbi:cytochrome ubiquinol oxidase subunit I [Nocardia stercoris]|uniref:Cytochrome ubiquinol oxidase subunit I n=1 Tax=Nocardia stercoris TaxID=2483361 RepID=A0A3M2KZA7_9NOCA|nr:cytochrome ubiquinol oxidase subunit I [Nocardia stercoris]RMI29613.1 cytochrome ubiquinol oxidase subunit I [Nocardia stercoris]
MSVVDVSRWQFGITTVYHFIFVPLTIGLAPLVAIMQTVWTVTGNQAWYRLTKFFGKLFMINFALGVVTGLVQEFQFGMNWSEYSRFVGDVFGAPLAMEALVAFFLEATFLGLWVFGWTRLPKLVHLATIWLVAVGVNASAYFIIAANSWMQHPVGAHYNADTGRAELDSIWSVLTNVTALAAFPHVALGALLTAGTFVAGIGGWWMVRSANSSDPGAVDDASGMWRPAVRLGLWMIVLSTVVIAVTGDIQGKLMFKQQPMKMASAESLCHTETDPDFSVLTVGTHNNCDSVTHVIKVPYVLPFLAEGKFSGVTLQGVKNIQAANELRYGPGNYQPNLFVTYWTFRAMITWLAGSLLLAAVGFYMTSKRRVPKARWFAILSLLMIPTPFLGNSAGWVFTEMGRQPWVVAPNPTGDPGIHLTVAQAVSANTAGTVWLSLIVFTLLYGALAVVWFYLMKRYTEHGPEAPAAAGAAAGDDTAVEQLSFAY